MTAIITRLYIHSLIFSVLLLGAFFVSLPQQAEAACSGQSLQQVGYGMSGQAVSALQGCLIDAGFAIPAGVTGYYGAQTKVAVSQLYATQLGLPAWNGMSVGPLGRAKLIGVVGGGSGVAINGVAPRGYKKVKNASELALYVAEGQKNSYGIASPQFLDSESDMVPASPMQSVTTRSGAGAERVSETTVQVAGIDEPDIVKTDGQNIYFSKEARYYGRPVPVSPMMVEDRIAQPPMTDESLTTVVQAFPPAELAEIGEIKERGEMLLVKEAKMLIILAQPEVVAYDISVPKKPVKKWSFSLENNTSLVTARLQNGTVYLVTQTWLNAGRPCPYIPITRGGIDISLPCGDIWVPSQLQPVNQVYTMLSLNPATGATVRTLSVAADSGVTTVAMFKDNLYVATKSYATPYEAMTRIAVAAASPYLSKAASEKIQRIQGYDISAAGKLSEIQPIITSDLARLPQNERLKVETDISNVIAKQFALRKRELDRTSLMRVALPGLTVAATGEIPGTLLNQFAIDEYNGNVRVAVTVGANSWGNTNDESVNDVYVLGSDLVAKGSVIDLGITERIYSVRFMGDTAYVVTFRQIDPFYVLNLANPAAPKLSGELKIPGYSAYLEPLGNGLILGVGREGSGVKLSVFDVNNPARPIEKSKYLIKDSWSEVESNHHAFLKDAEHSVFFVPGSAGGYVISYANGNLVLKATVAGWSVKRAVYLDDYMYIIGDEKITVLDETTWKEVKTLILK